MLPSARRQEDKQKTSRQSDVMPDRENMDTMLGKFPENDFANEPENEQGEIDIVSAGLHEITNTVREYFRSSPSINSRGNSDITEETVGGIKDELHSQTTRKLEEIKEGLNSPLLAAINTAIAGNVIHELQCSIGALESGLNQNWTFSKQDYTGLLKIYWPEKTP